MSTVQPYRQFYQAVITPFDKIVLAEDGPVDNILKDCAAITEPLRINHIINRILDEGFDEEEVEVDPVAYCTAISNARLKLKKISNLFEAIDALNPPYPDKAIELFSRQPLFQHMIENKLQEWRIPELTTVEKWMGITPQEQFYHHIFETVIQGCTRGEREALFDQAGNCGLPFYEPYLYNLRSDFVHWSDKAKLGLLLVGLIPIAYIGLVVLPAIVHWVAMTVIPTLISNAQFYGPVILVQAGERLCQFPPFGLYMLLLLDRKIVRIFPPSYFSKRIYFAFLSPFMFHGGNLAMPARFSKKTFEKLTEKVSNFSRAAGIDEKNLTPLLHLLQIDPLVLPNTVRAVWTPPNRSLLNVYNHIFGGPNALFRSTPLEFARDYYRIFFGPAMTMQRVISATFSNETERKNAMKAYNLWILIMINGPEHDLFAAREEPPAQESALEPNQEHRKS
jgi:hypothetical protein